MLNLRTYKVSNFEAEFFTTVLNQIFRNMSDFETYTLLKRSKLFQNGKFRKTHSLRQFSPIERQDLHFCVLSKN